MVLSPDHEAFDASEAFFHDEEFFQELSQGLPPPATINPSDLQTIQLMEDLETNLHGDLANGISRSFDDIATHGSEDHELNPHDSGVDLRGQWSSSAAKQGSMEPFDTLLSINPSSLDTSTPSPATDAVFSSANSPGDFVRDHSSVSSPEAPIPLVKQDSGVADESDLWDNTYSSDAILIPQSREVPHVHLSSDKTKTRAETQIKMTLTLDPLDNVDHIRFPRKTLAKPKHFASEEEKLDVEQKGGVLQMNVHLVCATALDLQEDRERALRRAAGTEEIPRRPEGVNITELDKDDPSHPQNGGEVIICDGCKERERKRYDRKKKRGEDEEEFSKYENDRVIMINEKEHKKLKEIDGGDGNFSPRARQVEFAMRIACYCRHQEEKSPMGYRVIFTFTLGKVLLVQHVSDVFHITDDHKNKDLSVETLPQRIAIPQGYDMASYHPQSNVVVPMYSYPQTYGMGVYSQPPTPIMSQFTSPISPMETPFPSQAPVTTMAQPSFTQAVATQMPQTMAQPMPTLTQQARQPSSVYPPTVPSGSASFARHQRGQSAYDTPLVSPTSQVGFGVETHGLPRPQSLNDFNFSYPRAADASFGQNPTQFYSAPPSAGGTPVNLSRPPSPTWEQGPNSKKNKQLSSFDSFNPFTSF